MSDMTGKIAVVTGGTQGLGATIAKLFAERGAAGIVTCGRRMDEGESIASGIKAATGCEVMFAQADLSNVDDCAGVLATCDKTFGRVDTLVNAAAISDRGNILNTDPELFDRIMSINLRAPFFLMQNAVKLMIRDGIEGTIVNIASMSSEAGQPFVAAYCASKGGLATLTRNTGYALSRNRIRVNGLNIGWMASDGEDAMQKNYHKAPADWLEKAAAEQPFGRLIDPTEVARAVAFLASNESGLMTGSMVNFDQSVWAGYDNPPLAAEKL